MVKKKNYSRLDQMRHDPRGFFFPLLFLFVLQYLTVYLSKILSRFSAILDRIFFHKLMSREFIDRIPKCKNSNYIKN